MMCLLCCKEVMVCFRQWEYMETQVNVSEEEDDFQLVITACLSVLILGTETKLDAALVQMTRLPWASLETVRPGSNGAPALSRDGARRACPCAAAPA